MLDFNPVSVSHSPYHTHYTVSMYISGLLASQVIFRSFVWTLECLVLLVGDASLGTVDSEDLKLNRAYIVHFVSLFKVLLSILHLNTIIAPFFHF